MNSLVKIYKTEGYNLQELKKIVADALSEFNFKGKKVLIKPNMLQAHSPEEGVTTHPILVEAAASVIIQQGGKCAVGDSPSGHGRANAEKAAEKAGFLDLCQRLDIEFDFFDDADLQKVDIPDGQIYRKLYLSQNFFSYDFILNLPKLKTHSLTVFTLGVKNMMGVVPGLGKVDFHIKAAHPVKFASAICDLYSAVTPNFTIVDAVVGMEGSGPVGGKLRKLNRIFASDDAVAVSAAIEKFCGVNPEKVPITAEAAKRGLGKKDNFSIIKKYSGDDSEFKNFKTPLLSVLGRKIPIWMLDFVPNIYLHRPKVIKKGCIKCTECARVCPAEAIDFSSRGFPEFDMKKCVKCFCCAERCPESAIIEQTNFIAKLFIK